MLIFRKGFSSLPPSSSAQSRKSPFRLIGLPALVAAVVTTTASLNMLGTETAEAAPCSRGADGKLTCGLGGISREPGNGGGPANNGGGGGELPELPEGGDGLPQAPEVEAPAPRVPTTVLAWEARAAAPVPVPRAHTAPEDKTYVRLRTNLWVDGFVRVSTPPVRSATDDRTVQAVATPYLVVWNVGEGTHTCTTAGAANSSACHYVYKRSSSNQPGGRYRITATIRWRVTWSCTGNDCDIQGGALEDLEMSSTQVPLAVGEIQTNSRD